MLIDWFTVTAQALNFLILVALLRHFLYQPILKAIDQREQRIAAALAEADTHKAEARLEREDFEARNTRFAHEHAERLQQSKAEAEQERVKILDQARTAAAALRDKHQAELQSQQASLYLSLQRKTAHEVFAIARQTLHELADAPLEAQMVAVFLQRLTALSATETEDLRKVFKAASEPVRVQTRFALSESLTAQVRKDVNDALGPISELHFETSDQINGIELSTAGQKLSWSISDYLSSLQKRLDDLLKTQHTPDAPDPAETASIEAVAVAEHA